MKHKPGAVEVVGVVAVITTRDAATKVVADTRAVAATKVDVALSATATWAEPVGQRPVDRLVPRHLLPRMPQHLLPLMPQHVRRLVLPGVGLVVAAVVTPHTQVMAAPVLPLWDAVRQPVQLTWAFTLHIKVGLRSTVRHWEDRCRIQDVAKQLRHLAFPSAIRRWLTNRFNDFASSEDRESWTGNSYSLLSVDESRIHEVIQDIIICRELPALLRAVFVHSSDSRTASELNARCRDWSLLGDYLQSVIKPILSRAGRSQLCRYSQDQFAF